MRRYGAGTEASDWSSIGDVVGDLIPLIGEPLPGFVPSDDAGSDPVYEAWVALEPHHVPAPSVIAACRRLVGDETAIRLIHRLHWQGDLRRYAQGDLFAELVAYFVVEAGTRGAA